MPKSSQKTRAEQATKAAHDGTGATNSDVVRALRQVFEAKYAKSWGDREAAVEAALRAMADNNSTNFTALTEIVNTRMFAGRKGGMFVEAAIAAYLPLLRLLQEKHEAAPLTQTKETHTKESETTKSDEASDIHEKSRAPECDATHSSISVKSERQRQGAIENAKAGGTSLMETATQKAAAEMAAKFDYDKLCEQGKELYQIVMIDKAKRIHSKMKYREKQRVSQS